MRNNLSTKTAVVISSITLVFAVMTSCGGNLRKSESTSVPEYRYPGVTHRNNLKLVSVLTDPYGESFLQGALHPKKANGKHNLRKPYASLTAGTDLLFLLDHAKGVIFRLDFETDGALAKTTVYPRKRRTFPSLVDMAIEPGGILWVVDSKLKTVFKLGKSGEIVDSIPGDFQRPVGITYEKNANQMLVTDLVNNSISAYSLDGKLVAKHDSTNGLKLESPSFITSDNDGRVYVVEALTAFVKIISPKWEIEKSIGGLGDGPGYFAKPKGIAVDKMKRMYVADALFDNVQVFDSTGALLLALGTTGDGAGEFWQPSGLHIDNQGRLFVADSFNRRVQVFRWETGE